MKLRNKITGVETVAVYATTPRGKKLYHINGEPISDKKLDTEWERVSDQPTPNKTEWKMIEPEKAKEYVIVNDGEENIYIGKDREKAIKMCKAVNMHQSFIDFVSEFSNYNFNVTKMLERANALIKQAEQK